MVRSATSGPQAHGAPRRCPGAKRALHLARPPLRRGRNQPVGPAARFRPGERFEAAILDRILHQQFGQHRPAQPGQRARQGLSGVRDGDRRALAFRQRHAPVDPAVRRAAMRFGAGHGHPRGGGEFHAFEIARPVHQPDRAVEIGFGEVGMLVRDEGKARLRLVGAEFRQPGGEPLGVEFARDGDSVAVARLPRLHRADAFFEFQEPFAQGIEPGGAFRRQLQPLAGAAEQDRAEMVLQRPDLLADGGGRHRQLVRGAGEGEVPGGRVVDAQGVQGQVGALHGASE